MDKNIKEYVKNKYSQIALNIIQADENCCGKIDANSCCTIMADDYSNIEGYMADADLGLGCGLPTEYANIKEGNVVVDLGSGAGNDAFIAAKLVGEKGKVIGIDFVPEMVARANQNAEKFGLMNVRFILGEIEQIPLPDVSVDVVLSNCVLNLVPDKKRAFNEIYRILKKGGHFCISDIVTIGILPENIRKVAELYVGCIAGALQIDEYIEIIKNSGFKDIKILTRKEIIIPKNILSDFLNENEINEIRNSNQQIISITISGVK